MLSLLPLSISFFILTFWANLPQNFHFTSPLIEPNRIIRWLDEQLQFNICSVSGAQFSPFFAALGIYLCFSSCKNISSQPDFQLYLVSYRSRYLQHFSILSSWYQAQLGPSNPQGVKSFISPSPPCGPVLSPHITDKLLSRQVTDKTSILIDPLLFPTQTWTAPPLAHALPQLFSDSLLMQ